MGGAGVIHQHLSRAFVRRYQKTFVSVGQKGVTNLLYLVEEETESVAHEESEETESKGRKMGN